MRKYLLKLILRYCFKPIQSLKLEVAKVRPEGILSSVHASVTKYPNSGKIKGIIFIHYQGSGCDMFVYEDLELFEVERKVLISQIS